jgi:hypothetical protein
MMFGSHILDRRLGRVGSPSSGLTDIAGDLAQMALVDVRSDPW